MIYDRLYGQNMILGQAMQASIVRNDVINNNIANAETPGFKARRVVFEESLDRALTSSKKTGQLDLTKAKPNVQYVHEDFHYRLDQNNVDIEAEMVALYQNSIKYDALANAVLNNSKRINLVISGR